MSKRAPKPVPQSKPQPVSPQPKTPETLHSDTVKGVNATPPPADNALTAATLPVLTDINTLPMTFGDVWSLDIGLDHKENLACLIRADLGQMEDGTGGTPIILTLEPNRLHIKTRSNIDISYADDGIQIDEKWFAIETVSKGNQLGLHPAA